MKSNGRVLLLVGSARRPRSTSESLGTYLLEGLRKRGFETETLIIPKIFGSDEARNALLAATDRADILLLAFPLYVDSPPALVIKGMELINRHRHAGQELKSQRLLVIVNCGFPEAQHNNTAIAICRRFSQEAGLDWAGGLSLGGGAAISGRPLVKMGGMVRNVIRSLDLASDALAEGNPIPREAVDLMSKPLIPSWVYMLLGALGWKRQAKRFGTRKKLSDRPY